MFFLSKLQESAYKPVYAVICTDGIVSLMSNITTRDAQTRCVIVMRTFNMNIKRDPLAKKEEVISLASK